MACAGFKVIIGLGGIKKVGFEIIVVWSLDLDPKPKLFKTRKCSKKVRGAQEKGEKFLARENVRDVKPCERIMHGIPHPIPV